MKNSKILFSNFRRSLAMRVQMPNPSHAETPKRTGLLGIKVGMVPGYDKFGIRHALTVLHLEDNQVLKIRTMENDGVNSLVIGSGLSKPKNVDNGRLNLFFEAGTPPKRDLAEFVTDPEAFLEPGTRLNADHFVVGQYVDCRSLTTGKGFQGVMRKWNFKGMPASHGVTKAHRKGGAVGASQGGGKVHKGKKMPGHMGNKYRTVQNLMVFKIDPAKGLLYLKGHIPGKPGNLVRIKDAVKKVHTYIGMENEHYLENIQNYRKYMQETLKIRLPFPTKVYESYEDLQNAPITTYEGPETDPLIHFK